MMAAGNAQAVLIEPEQHWKYWIDSWKWDGDMHRTHGIIIPTLVIENQTQGRLEGYIADSKGAKLDFYDGEQVVMARFVKDNGFTSKWGIADKIEGGNFAIQIPEQYKNADKVDIYIGNNQYTVNDGTDTTPQTWVFVNSLRTSYSLDSAIQQPETVTAAQQKPAAWKTYSEDSLIDKILLMYGMRS